MKSDDVMNPSTQNVTSALDGEIQNGRHLQPVRAMEDIIEAFLIQHGFTQHTPRGPLLTAAAFKHLGLPEPQCDPSQFGLFGDDREDQQSVMAGLVPAIHALQHLSPQERRGCPAQGRA